jgi:hypothetical protein
MNVGVCRRGVEVGEEMNVGAGDADMAMAGFGTSSRMELEMGGEGAELEEPPDGDPRGAPARVRPPRPPISVEGQPPPSSNVAGHRCSGAWRSR